MPILKREPDIFPEHLFELPGDSFPWWVAHLRSRQEKLAAREAAARGVPFYLPQREQRQRRHGRVRISHLPLFTGYLFFRGDLDQRLEVLKTNLCVRILNVEDQGALQHDLRQIHSLQARGLPLVPHPELTIGNDVRVTEGPFAGLSGRVIQEKGKYRFVVAVRFIHRFVSVELPSDVLAPVPPAALEAVGRSEGR